jgi:hypothetical protein
MDGNLLLSIASKIAEGLGKRFPLFACIPAAIFGIKQNRD